MFPDPDKSSLSSLTMRSSLRNTARSLFTASAPIKRTPVRTAVYTTAAVLSAGLFAVYYADARSALHRYIVTPILRHAFDPETGHKIAIKVLKSGLAPRDFTKDDKVLNCQVKLPLNTSRASLMFYFFLDLGSENIQSSWSRCWFWQGRRSHRRYVGLLSYPSDLRWRTCQGYLTLVSAGLKSGA